MFVHVCIQYKGSPPTSGSIQMSKPGTARKLYCLFNLDGVYSLKEQGMLQRVAKPIIFGIFFKIV